MFRVYCMISKSLGRLKSAVHTNLYCVWCLFAFWFRVYNYIFGSHIIGSSVVCRIWFNTMANWYGSMLHTQADQPANQPASQSFSHSIHTYSNHYFDMCRFFLLRSLLYVACGTRFSLKYVIRFVWKRIYIHMRAYSCMGGICTVTILH